MILIIPLIEIQNGRCLFKVQGTESRKFSDDPIEVVKLWRKENAKSLYLTDIGAVLKGNRINFDLLKRTTDTVDIPIQYGGGVRTFNDVKKTFDSGAYRVVIGTMFIDNFDEAVQALEHYDASRIVLNIDAKNGIVKTNGRRVNTGLTFITVALNAMQVGFKRIIFRNIPEFDFQKKDKFEEIKTLADKTQLHITAFECVSTFKDLLELQSLEQLGIDSVVIGKALYENKFACQGLWRLCENGNYPYTAKV